MRVRDHSAGGAGEVDLKGFGALEQRIVGDADGEGLGGVTGCKVQSTVGGGVVCACNCGVISRGVLHGRGHSGAASLGDSERHGASGFVDGDVVDAESWTVVV